MKQILPDKVYDVLKWIAIIALPAFSIFYDRIGAVWALPYTEQICETLDAVAVLLGALLCVSAIQYATDKAAEGQKQDYSADLMAEVDNLYANDEERENGE